MAIYVGLLRAINLGSHNKVSMADLRELLAELGMKNPQSLLPSGNLVFETTARATAPLEKMLEAAAAQKLRLETAFFVRTGAEWQQAIADNPFPKEARLDPGHTVLMCLKDAPPPAAVQALQDAIKGRETVKARGRQAYFLYPDGMGTSKLTMTPIEKKLGTTGTARNWNTVLKLGAPTEKS
ncbi:MAG: DUF1697 domain-containing protein [Acidobacteria bacterium]|nr:DUF1697 domain-containing protein [Acidobacteriota bacterium]